MRANVLQCSLAAAVVAVIVAAPGCGKKKVQVAPPSPAAPSMTGPTFLRGTIGSLVRVRDFQPQLVSGHGLVVLPAGSETGSTFVPAWLRQSLINNMLKRGMGSARLRTEDLTPSRVLSRRDTVVVEVFGFIPPGAVPGAPFDVVIKTLDEDPDATSLAGGILYTTDLAPGGANRQNLFKRPVAEARGAAYINPFDDRAEEERKYDFRRRALVVAGGKVTSARPVQLVLNQPSWSNSRLIADRINDRFSRVSDRKLIAEAQTDVVINVNVPDRFAGDPAFMVNLMSHCFVQTGGGFEQEMTHRLGEQLRRNPGNDEIAQHVTYCWQSMGRAAIDVLRKEFYDDPQLDLRLAALRAGAWLGDERAGEPLAALADHEDPTVRMLAIEALANLPRNNDAFGKLVDLLSDDDQAIRIAAYETLAANGDAVIGRVLVEDDQGIKFMIDRVPSDKPLIYITPRGFPRIAIFQPDMQLQAPTVASLWGSQLMMRVEPQARPQDVHLEVYYKTPGQPPRQLKAEPLVATLIYMLGHFPTMDQPSEGLDLTFSQVADALFTLCENGTIDAPIQVQTSPLARLAEEIPNQLPELRPETGPDAAPASDFPDAPDAPVIPDARPESGVGMVGRAETGG